MKENMDDGEVELSDHVLIPNSDTSTNINSNSFLDDLLRNTQTCTHTHTCNPPSPDATTHTHTCYHTHTHVIPSEEDNEKSPGLKPRRPSGNREAVKKYREKKKAHAAYLEEEVKKLRYVNKVLMGKLQKQAILEKEIVRLKGLLSDLRGKIDNELGDFPFRKQCGFMNDLKQGECGVRPTSVNDVANGSAGSFDPSIGIGGCQKTLAIWEGNCQPAIVECEVNEKYTKSAEK